MNKNFYLYWKDWFGNMPLRSAEVFNAVSASGCLMLPNQFILVREKFRNFKGVFVTGTGTEVGKTFVACKIAQDLRRQGIDIGVMKPISSGGTEDARLLKQAVNSKDSLDQINPLRFKYPLAPYSSALLEKRSLSLMKVFSAYRQLSNKHEFMIVEGIGGVRVPLTKELEVSDLIAQMGLPAIVVASAKLGTINHTLLTLDHLKSKKVKVLGIVLNFFDPSKMADRAGLDFFKRKKIPLLAIFSWRLSLRQTSRYLQYD